MNQKVRVIVWIIVDFDFVLRLNPFESLKLLLEVFFPPLLFSQGLFVLTISSIVIGYGIAKKHTLHEGWQNGRTRSVIGSGYLIAYNKDSGNRSILWADDVTIDKTKFNLLGRVIGKGVFGSNVNFGFLEFRLYCLSSSV